MRPLLAATLLAFVSACGSPPEDRVDPVPLSNAGSANNLMAEAENAATNASARQERMKPSAEGKEPE